MDHHVHRTARLGASVLISESWYKPFLWNNLMPGRYPGNPTLFQQQGVAEPQQCSLRLRRHADIGELVHHVAYRVLLLVLHLKD